MMNLEKELLNFGKMLKLRNQDNATEIFSKFLKKCSRKLIEEHCLHKTCLFTGRRRDDISNIEFNVNYSKSFGSGFFIKFNNVKYLVTANHVIDNLTQELVSDSELLIKPSSKDWKNDEMPIKEVPLNELIVQDKVVKDTNDDFFICNINDSFLISDDECFDINNIQNFTQLFDLANFMGYPYSKNKNIYIKKVDRNKFNYFSYLNSIHNDGLFIYQKYDDPLNISNERVDTIALNSTSGSPLLAIDLEENIMPIGILIEYCKETKNIKFVNLKNIINMLEQT